MKRLSKLLILLLFLPSAELLAQDLRWVRTYTGSTAFGAEGIAIDSNQNVIVVGWFEQTVDFDPGPGTYNLTSSGGSDCFVQKLDPSGNLIWAKSYNAERVFEVEVDGLGNIYLSGHNQSINADFDPGPGVYSPPGLTNADQYVAKWDANGSLLWAVRFESGFSAPASLELDDLGGVIVAGQLSTFSADFDPGPAVQMVTRAGGNGDTDIFILKLDTAGAFVWVRSMGSTSGQIVQELESDRYGNLYVTGDFFQTLDFDPGPGTWMMTSGSAFNRNGYVAKLDAGGNLVWAKGFLGSGGIGAQCVNVDDAGNSYVGGTFGGIVDLDPGSGTAFENAIPNTSYLDGFLVKLDVTGKFIWGKRWEGPDEEGIQHVRFADNGDLFIAGRAETGADLDPGAGSFIVPGISTPSFFFSRLDVDGDFLWGKYLQTGTMDIIGKGFQVGPDTSIYAVGRWGTNIDFDPGPNTHFVAGTGGLDNHFWGQWKMTGCNSLVCVFDSVSSVSCLGGGGYASLAVSGGAAPYSFQWNGQSPTTISSMTTSSPGIYSVIVRDSNLCSQHRQVLIDGPLYPIGVDLRTDLSSGSFRPGFSSHVWVSTQNQGCVPAGGMLQLVYDSQSVSFQASNPMPSSITGDTIRWQLPQLTSDSADFLVDLTFQAHISLSMQSLVCMEAEVLVGLADEDSTNNQSARCYEVNNGYDPNFKEVYPQGVCQPHYVDLDEGPFAYTIHFQNTGNAAAINVVVLDTLDYDLDERTIRIIGHSHPMVAELLPGRVLEFRFDNIQLPDSNTSEPLSHGYVTFEVAPDSGLEVGTTILNGSAIYFDFNAPVLTNLVHNMLVDTVPEGYSSSASAMVCLGDSFVFPDGHVQHNIQGNITYTSRFLSIDGCDSTITTAITLGTTYGQIAVTSCEEYLAPSGSNSWSNSGTYFDTIPNIAGCDSVVTIQLTVHHPDASVLNLGDSLVALQVGAAFQWLDCNNALQLIPGATGQTLVPTQPGSYALEVSLQGCLDTSSCYAINLLGGGPVGQVAPTVAPNPTNGEFWIDFHRVQASASVELYDLRGELTFKVNIDHQSKVAVSPMLPPGLYFLRIATDEGGRFLQKVVVY